VYYLLPDLRTPCFTPAETIDAVINQMPSQSVVSITTDSFFASLNWLRAHPNHPVTFGVAAGDVPEISIFSHNMHHHEYRLFTDGEILLSFWLDNKLVITASNMFNCYAPTTRRIYRGTDCSNLEPCLSLSAIGHLSQLSGEDLKELARMCGITTGTNY
jgi:hypothetical protein